MKKRFQKVYIEITNQCNLHCSFCPTDGRPPRRLSAEEFEHIVNSVKDYTDYICLHVKGEPLTHPDLPAILAIAHRYHLQVNLTTNATLLADKGALLFGGSAPRQVSLSLHSFDANTMHTQDFDTYLSEAFAFGKAFTAQTSGFISYRLWNLDADADSKPDIDTDAKPDTDTDADSTAGSDDTQRARNQHILEALEASYNLTETVTSKTGRYHGNAIAERTYVNFDHLFDWPSIDAPDYGCHGSCYGLRKQLAILSDGRVVPCCLDDHGILALGNIFDESLEMILQKEKSLRIIEGFSRKQITEPLCRHCGFRTRF